MPVHLRSTARRLLNAVAGPRPEPGQAPEQPTAEYPDAGVPPWTPLSSTEAVQCNICRWWGNDFVNPGHSEGSLCPRCGSIGRDRYLHWCFAQGVPLNRGLRVIETSPRLGQAYRDAMATWFFYRTSDFDGRAHRGNLKLDLQQIDMPDACVDVVLTAHVLEHVPDTDAALRELHRIVVPGGHVVLQVPVLQGDTAPPTEPEFHGDNTPVFWRFGFDLTERIRSHGFDTRLLSTQRWADRVRTGSSPDEEPVSPEFDVESMLASVVPADLEPVADEAEATRHGFEPSYMYLTWVAKRL